MEFPAKFKDNAEGSTGLAFVRAYNEWYARIRLELKRYDITILQFGVLSTLNFFSQWDETVSQVSIAKMADIDVVAVSRIIRGLEGKGYLTRGKNARDTRAKAVRLLPGGHEIVKVLIPRIDKIDEEFFGVLGAGETAFRSFLQRLL